MGHICEGMETVQIPIQRIAEAEHGSLWFDENSHNIGDKNPPIKDDKELIDILSAASESPWDEKRLYRLRSRNWEVKTYETPEQKSKCRELQRDVVKFQGLKPLPEYKIEPIKRRKSWKANRKKLKEIATRLMEDKRNDVIDTNELRKNIQSLKTVNQGFSPNYIPFKIEVQMNGRFVDKDGNLLKH